MKKAQAKAKRHIYSSGLAGCGGKAEPTNAKNAGQPINCPFCDRIFKQDGRFKEHLKSKHPGQDPSAASEGAAVDDKIPDADANRSEEKKPEQKAAYSVKTPKMLLNEWCQKNKRPMPKFKHMEVEGGFHCRLVLPDARDSERDSIFWYRETVCPTEQDAQNFVAVMGLHWVMGDRRMDRVLQEQYQQQWKDLDKVVEERKEREKRRQQQPKRRPAPPKELQPVFMSEHSRRLVEGLIFGESSGTSALAGEAVEADWDSESSEHDEESGTGKQDELVDWGRNESETCPAPSSDVLSVREDVVGETPESATRQAGVECDGSKDCNEDTAKETNSEVENALEPELTRPQFVPHGGHESSREASRGGRQVAVRETENLRSELTSMGFQKKDIDRALKEVATVPAALDWLMLHVAEVDLPEAFAPDASIASVKVVHRGAQRQGEGLSGERIKRTALQLCQSGYLASDVQSALFASDGDEIGALCLLFRDLAGVQEKPTDARNEVYFNTDKDYEELAQMREDERLALEAIYGENVVTMTESYMAIHLPMVPNLPKQLLLEVHIPPQSRYPLELPVLRLKGSDFTPHFMRSLTESTVGHAWQLLGQCMIYELICFLAENAPTFWDSRAVNKFHNQDMNLRAGTSRQTRRGPHALAVETVNNKPRQQKTGAEVRTMQNSRMGNHAAAEPVHLPELSDASIAAKQRMQEEALRAARSESLRLLEGWKQWQKGERFASMRAGRSRLPAFKERSTLLQAIKSSAVTVVSGQTGCGKSTQVPQYVLEDAIENNIGGSCNIICTQPRRISAVGLADRVSQERGEAIGETVGYAIRLESRRSVRTRLLFCTTGILLRRMQADPDLADVSHVVVDEVHERSLESDLLLLLLRGLVRKRGRSRSGFGQLRIILMSATADAALFVNYFAEEGQPPPRVSNIPGFTHPVRELYLGDVFELTGYRVGRNSKFSLKKGKGLPAGSTLQAESNSVSEGGSVPDSWEVQAATSAKTVDGASSEGIPFSDTTLQSLAIVNEEFLNYELMEAVIYQILLDSRQPDSKYGYLTGEQGKGQTASSDLFLDKSGAILVFLPGVAEIRRLQSVLGGSRRITELSGNGGLWILPLHGSLAGDEQRRVFSKPPPGVRKVVLATNIAETSITIDDVVYVVDSGRVKEMRYEHSRGMSCLVDTWVSRASAGQRRGRAGRVQAGCCVRLFSRRTFAQMSPQQEPEILRVPLESLCLQVLSLIPAPVEGTLAMALSPPPVAAVSAALKVLLDLQALTDSKDLTPLGQHLAKMPVNPRIGKMLIFACLLRCLEPIVTIAAAMSNRSPFISPMDRHNEANDAKRQLGGASKSDHLAIVSAYNGWREACAEGTYAERTYCERMFLSREALVAMDASRIDYVGVLVDLGFVSGEYHRNMKQRQRQGEGPASASDYDVNSRSIRIVKAALCAGLYPQVVRVQHPETIYAQQHAGTVAKDAAARELKFFTKDDGRVFLHPSSINFIVGKYESGWLVYGEKVQTSKVYVRECTMVPAYALLLFGGDIQVEHVKQVIRVDKWMEFQAPARIAVLVKELRARVDDAFARKISDSTLEVWSLPVVEALVHLLSTDGF